MIIAPNFVWIHIGRTGGYMVDRIFRDLQLPDVELDPLGGIWSDWKRHQTIEARSEEIGQNLDKGRVRISNFRRLPAWALSFSEYKLRHEGLHFTTAEMAMGILKAEMKDPETGEVIPNRFRVFNPDEILEHYHAEKVETWWRTDHIIEDCLDTIARYYDLPNLKADRWKDEKVNANVYNRNLLQRFSPEQLRSLYEACPRWTSIEKQVYGGLLYF
jgi:hypothetical protein